MNKKSKQLGMNPGTAAHRLRKQILWWYIQQTNDDICFQCGKKIEQIEDLSIEHKVPWLDSDKPVALYFDLSNIAFSHIKCNSGAKRYTGNPQTMVALKCAACFIKFERKLHQVNSKKKYGQRDFYCSHKCSGKAVGKGFGIRDQE